MVNHLLKIISGGFLMLGFSAFATVLAWGGIILFPLGLLLGGPLLFILSRIQSYGIAPLEEKNILQFWRKMPEHNSLESIAEDYHLPAMISHKNSTEIVYANSAARRLLGVPLLGRTMQSEEYLPYKPILVNGAKVLRENHPAALVKASQGSLKADVIWGTPYGEQPFEFQARRLFTATQEVGEFFLITLHSQKRKSADSRLCACM